MVRADVDPDWEDDLRPFYEELLGLLCSLVSKNLIVCPTSSFHDDESDPGPPIVRKGAWAMAEELSDGLRFRNWADIFFDQVIAAVRAYCGATDPRSTEWSGFRIRSPDSQNGFRTPWFPRPLWCR